MKLGWFVIGFILGTIFGSLITKIIFSKIIGGFF